MVRGDIWNCDLGCPDLYSCEVIDFYNACCFDTNASTKRLKTTTQDPFVDANTELEDLESTVGEGTAVETTPTPEETQPSASTADEATTITETPQEFPSPPSLAVEDNPRVENDPPAGYVPVPGYNVGQPTDPSSQPQPPAIQPQPPPQPQPQPTNTGTAGKLN